MTVDWRRRWLTVIVVSLAPGLGWCADDKSASDAPVAQQVQQLVRQLDVDSRESRELAEKKLLDLGPTALPHLPSPDAKDVSAEQRQRLRRILPGLWKKKLEQEVAGSRVTLGPGKMTLAEAVASLRKQSGNAVTDMREQLNEDVLNPTLELNLKNVPFWQAIDQVARDGGLSLYFETEDRSLGLRLKSAGGRPVDLSGAFRFEVDKLILERMLDEEGASEFRASVRALVEPRLKPMLIELDSAKIIATDDKGRALVPAGPDEIPIAVDPATIAIPLVLRFAAPPRDATKIAKLQGELAVWLPAHTQTFKFPALAPGKGAAQSSSGQRVEVRGMTVEDGVWSYPIIVESPPLDAPAESHLQAAIENEVYLEKADGARFRQNGGMSTIVDEPGRSGAEYLFVDAPGKPEDYTLVVRAPAGVTSVPVRFTFKDLPLP
jgi:hypothetical protein